MRHPRPRLASSALVLLAALVTMGCAAAPTDEPPASSAHPSGASPNTTGTVPAPGRTTPLAGLAPTPEPPMVPEPASGTAAGCGAVSFARRPLSERELRHTLADLLGGAVEPDPEGRWGESHPYGYGFFSRMGRTPLPPPLREDLAKRAADGALATIDDLLPCPPGQARDAACAGRFIELFTPRVFRRPPTPAELEGLKAWYAENEQRAGFEAGLRAYLERVLASDTFLFHPAYPRETEVERASQAFGVASRLSYLIWETLPDQALWAAAERGDLLRKDGFERELGRLLADPRARRTVANFHAEWLDIDPRAAASLAPAPDPTLPVEFWPGLAASAAAFVDHVFWDESGTLSTFLRAPYLFADRRMDPQRYGLPAPASDAPVKADAPAGERFGILTQPWFLARTSWGLESNPVARGAFVQRNLLCVSLPPPPSGFNPPPPEPAAGQSMRERLSAHSSQPQCHGCHRYLDPLGFGLDNFDGLGVHQATRGGKPIDTSGKLALASGERDFADLRGLVETLAGLGEVETCVVQQWVAFTLARPIEAKDACHLERLRGDLAAAGGRLSALLPAAAGLLRPTD